MTTIWRFHLDCLNWAPIETCDPHEGIEKIDWGRSWLPKIRAKGSVVGKRKELTEVWISHLLKLKSIWFLRRIYLWVTRNVRQLHVWYFVYGCFGLTETSSKRIHSWRIIAVENFTIFLQLDSARRIHSNLTEFRAKLQLARDWI